MIVYLSLLLALIILNLWPTNLEKRKKVILPVSFILIFLFLGLRYDYGLDYFNYYNVFYDPNLRDRDYGDEPLFWKLFFFFEKFYQLILFQSFIIASTYYYFVKKYVPPRYYALFFILFMGQPGLMLNIMSAIRFSFAVVVFLWGTEFFFLRKTNWVLYSCAIIASFLFHNGALLFVPLLLGFQFSKFLTYKRLLLIIPLCIVVGAFYISNILVDTVGMLETNDVADYSYYVDNDLVSNTTFSRIVVSLLLLPGAVFAFKYFEKETRDSVPYKIMVYGVMFALLYLTGLDFQSRFTAAVSPFYILSTISVLDLIDNKKIKYFIICSIILFVSYRLRNFFVDMGSINYIYHSGNPLFYKTIFDVTPLP